MKFHVQMSVNADVSVPVEIPDKVIAELLDGEPFDSDNEDHLNALADIIWEYDVETPTICAQCSGWGRPHSLDLGDDFQVTSVYTDDVND